MLKILHFSDAHIDMANFGKLDVATGLPMRVMDFLKSLDEIIDTAINEKVDAVIFSGDAYKDRSPLPTHAREWGRRIMRLSHAKIPTILLTGNHDSSPTVSRAHAIHEFSTLEVPYIHVVDKPCVLTPDDLDGLPLQVIGLPWVFRSGRMASLGVSAELDQDVDIIEELEVGLTKFLRGSLDGMANPELPVILAAHASIAGAVMGNERSIMLGKDLVLPGGLVKDKRLSYVALGHIHKAQDLNEGLQPPVIYPGSIERVDFGEVRDEKFFVIAHIEKGKDTTVEWRQLKHIRPFIDLSVNLTSTQDVTQTLLQTLPNKAQMADAIIRLVVNYPRELETMIDEKTIRASTEGAFEFYLVKRPQFGSRVRLPNGRETSTMSSMELLGEYWKAGHVVPNNQEQLNALAKKVIDTVEGGTPE